MHSVLYKIFLSTSKVYYYYHQVFLKVFQLYVNNSKKNRNCRHPYHAVCGLASETQQVIHREEYVFIAVVQVTVIEDHRWRTHRVLQRFDSFDAVRRSCQLRLIRLADVKVVGIPRFDADLHASR